MRPHQMPSAARATEPEVRAVPAPHSTPSKLLQHTVHIVQLSRLASPGLRLNTGIVLFECSCWAQQKSSLSTGIFPFSVRGAWLQFEASQDPLGAH